MLPTVQQSLHGNSLVRTVMPELDVLRGIAIISVVVFHSFSWTYEGKLHFSRAAEAFLAVTRSGWLGVNLFFVLSGFLITGILLESKEQPNYYRRFYLRRALRILPIYYTLLLTQLVLGWSTSAYFALNVFFLSNITNLFGVVATCGPLWSLSVEEHYYSVWPMISRQLTRRQLAMCALAICIVVPLLRGVWFGLGHNTGLGLRTYTWFVADNLAAGSLLAVVVRSTQTRRHILRLCLALLIAGVGMAVLLLPFGILQPGPMQGEVEAVLQLTFASICFSGLLLLFLLLGTSSWNRLTHWPLLGFFGYISYGLYLFHMTAFSLYDALTRRFWPSLQPQDNRFDLVILRFVLAGALAVTISYLSRRFFEDKFLRMKKPLEGRFLKAARPASGTP